MSKMIKLSTYRWAASVIAVVSVFLGLLIMYPFYNSERAKRIELKAELRECDWQLVYSLNEMQKLYNKGLGGFVDSVLGYDTIPVIHIATGIIGVAGAATSIDSLDSGQQ